MALTRSISAPAGDQRQQPSFKGRFRTLAGSRAALQDGEIERFSAAGHLTGVIILLLTIAMPATAAVRPSQATLLPAPNGPSAVGRMTFHWIDSTRAIFLDPAAAARREILVDVWYPTDATGTGAGYLPHLEAFRVAMADSVARRRFAPVYAAVEAGILRTHATEGAPVRCQAGGCPLLTFSHGGGVDRSLYTAQYEELVSHGYVVTAIAHTGDTHRVVFPDGRSVRAAPPPPVPEVPEWRALTPLRRGFMRSEANANHGRRVLRVAAADIRFVIDRMAQLAGTRGSAFEGAVDLSRIGALGHSAGGMAAALACQLDARIRACLNQDGAMGNLPFDRDPRRLTMTQPFLYLTRPYSRPVESDSLIAALETTRAELKAHLDWIQFRPDTLVSEMPAAWRVTIRLAGMPHMGFSDEPLIVAAGDSVKTRTALAGLRLVSAYTLAFFDKTLRGATNTALDRADTALVQVERFGR